MRVFACNMQSAQIENGADIVGCLLRFFVVRSSVDGVAMVSEPQIQSHRKIFVELQETLSGFPLHSVIKSRIEEDLRRKVLIHLECNGVFPFCLDARIAGEGIKTRSPQQSFHHCR